MLMREKFSQAALFRTQSERSPMRPIFEKIQPNQGSSFYVERFRGDECCPLPYWHLHPEYEIVYLERGAGQCHVGRHQSQFEEGLLIMLGPNLAHAPFGPQGPTDSIEVVIQFQEDFVGDGWKHHEEWHGVRRLMDRSSQGILFGTRARAQVGPRLIALKDLSPLPRLLTLLTVLGELAVSDDLQLLDAGEPGLLLSSGDYDRIHEVMAYVQTHFQNPIPLHTVAELTHLTVPAFCRFFKRTTQKTFNTYLQEYRIYRACHLLQGQELSISEISYQCGYQQPAYFNRQFKRITGQTPREYQRQFARWVAGNRQDVTC